MRKSKQLRKLDAACSKAYARWRSIFEQMCALHEAEMQANDEYMKYEYYRRELMNKKAEGALF